MGSDAVDIDAEGLPVLRRDADCPSAEGPAPAGSGGHPDGGAGLARGRERILRPVSPSELGSFEVSCLKIKLVSSSFKFDPKMNGKPGINDRPAWSTTHQDIDGNKG